MGDGDRKKSLLLLLHYYYNTRGSITIGRVTIIQQPTIVQYARLCWLFFFGRAVHYGGEKESGKKLVNM